MTVSEVTGSVSGRSAAVVFVLAAVMIAVTLFSARSGSAKEYEFTVGSIVSAGLTDQKGQKISAADLKNRLVLVNFFFTSCGAACPVQTSVLREVQGSVEQNIGIVFLSVSIAPMLDTNEAVRSYIKKFDVDQPNWKFVTANVENTKKLIKKFGVTVENEQLVDDEIDHRNLGYLFGKNGMLMQQYQLLPKVTKRLVREITELDQFQSRT